MMTCCTFDSLVKIWFNLSKKCFLICQDNKLVEIMSSLVWLPWPLVLQPGAPLMAILLQMTYLLAVSALHSWVVLHWHCWCHSLDLAAALPLVPFDMRFCPLRALTALIASISSSSHRLLPLRRWPCLVELLCYLAELPVGWCLGACNLGARHLGARH